MGLLAGPLAEMSILHQLCLVVEAHAGKLLGRLASLLASPLRMLGLLRRRRLTDTYLDDPELNRPVDPENQADLAAG
jgi:hypothetical protein